MMTPALRNVATRVAFGRPACTYDGAVRETVLNEMRRLIERCQAW
jgi:hypothetical protein